MKYKGYLIGSDGNNYSFLLKGHEDPRQDERVMQFFRLINTLLLHNGDTSRRNVTIEVMMNKLHIKIKKKVIIEIFDYGSFTDKWVNWMGT